MIKLIEEYDNTREERLKLIKDFIKRMENDDIEGINEDIIYRYETYDETKDDAVLDGYNSYFVTYFENNEDGCDFVEEYYGDDTDTFYKELEQAIEEYVSTFSDDDIYSFFEERDEPLNPGDMDYYINGFGYSYKPHRFGYNLDDRW